MADAKRDQNRVTAALAELDSAVGPWKADHVTGFALVLITPETVPPTGADGDAIRDANRVCSKLALDGDDDGDVGNWMADSNQLAYTTNS